MTADALPLTLTRHDEVRAALKDRRLLIHKPLANGEQAVRPRTSDSAGHRSHRIAPVREPLALQLAPRAIAHLADFIEDAVAEAVSAAERCGHIDIVSDLAFPLPVMVMARLLGVQHEDFSALRPLFEAISRGHDIGSTSLDRQRARLAQATIVQWLGPKLRQSEPTPLLQAIQDAAADDGGSAAIVGYWCAMLLYAGSATTRDLITNGTALLVQHPSAAHQLAEDRTLVEPAIEEFLRFDGPVCGVGRVAAEDLTIGAHAIGRGELIYLMLDAANRDPERFRDAHVFDITRTPNPHLGFGMGATHCLGAQLARMEARIAFSHLRRLLPNANACELDDWNPLRLMRQRNSLKLTLTRRLIP